MPVGDFSSIAMAVALPLPSAKFFNSFSVFMGLLLRLLECNYLFLRLDLYFLQQWEL
jgi:hypothetical protein